MSFVKAFIEIAIVVVPFFVILYLVSFFIAKWMVTKRVLFGKQILIESNIPQIKILLIMHIIAIIIIDIMGIFLLVVLNTII